MLLDLQLQLHTHFYEEKVVLYGVQKLFINTVFEKDRKFGKNTTTYEILGDWRKTS